MIGRLLWTVPLAVLVLAGCSGPASPTVATAQAPATPTAAPSSAPPPETDYDKALRYTRCLTANGVETRDPVIGEMLVTYAFIDFANPDLNRMNAARQAHKLCKQYLPATWPIRLDAKEVARSRAYVECMRKNGIDEPLADANNMIQQPTDDSWGLTPEYEASVRKCRHLVDDAANDLPENR